MTELYIFVYKCKKCGYVWVSKQKGPKVCCPRCHVKQILAPLKIVKIDLSNGRLLEEHE